MLVSQISQDEFYRQLGAAVRDVRLAQNKPIKSLRGMAERLGCHGQQLHQMERGIDFISLHRLMLFCMETQTNPGLLLSFIGIPATIRVPTVVREEQVFRDNLRRRVIDARKRVGKSTQDVAERAGFCARQLRYYEGGEHQIRAYPYFQLAAALDWTPKKAGTALVISAHQRAPKP